MDLSIALNTNLRVEYYHNEPHCILVVCFDCRGFNVLSRDRPTAYRLHGHHNLCLKPDKPDDGNTSIAIHIMNSLYTSHRALENGSCDESDVETMALLANVQVSANVLL